MKVRFAFLLCSLLLLMPSHSMAQDPSKRLTQAEAEADVRQFFSTLQRVHPDLLAKVDVRDYIKLKQQTLDDVAQNLDSEGKINLQDFASSLYYAAAFFKDAHTSVLSNDFAWPNESNTAGKRFPSFLMGYDNDRFVIAASSDENIDGLEIVSINGKPVLEFISPILDRVSGETLAWKTHRFTGVQAFWYNFCNLCDSGKSLSLKLRDSQGKETEQNVETVNFAEFQKLNSQKPANKLQELRKKGTQVYFLDSDSAAYLVYPSFIYSDDEKKKIDSIFEEIKAKNARNLIVDLRDNSGGASAMGDFIFRYLHKGHLHQNSKVRTKVSNDVLSPSYTKFLTDVVGADLAGKYHIELVKRYAGLEGMVVAYQGEDPLEQVLMVEQENNESAPKPKAFFSGRVLLLVDNGTFSSASMFATTFRDYNVGAIMGYETGGLPIGFGDVYPFQLDNSGLQCGVSWKQFFGPKPRPGDDEHGVIPDIPMNDKLLRPYQKEDDPVLAYTLDYIKKTRGVAK